MYQKSISSCNELYSYVGYKTFSNKERKGIWFQFHNLLSIRLSLVSNGRKAIGLKD